MSEHLLLEISTWAEVAILLFMVWERYGPSIWVKHVTPIEAIPRKGFWPAIWANRTLIVALCGLGFIGWLYLGHNAQTEGVSISEYQLSENNARLDFWKMERSYEQEAFVNAYLINDGKTSALKVRHLGILVVGPSEILPERRIIASLAMLRTQIALLEFSETEISPKQKSVWFSIYGPQLSKSEIKEFADGKLFPIALNIMRYTDPNIPEGKFIYTESCVILYKNDVVGFCKGNHNKSYVAD